MEPIYRFKGYDSEGRPHLQQLELHGRTEHFYALRWADVWATDLLTARYIQRDFLDSEGR